MTHPSVTSKLDAVTCCKPTRAHAPRGWMLLHSSRCVLYPGQKIKDTHPELFRGPLPPGEPHAACRLSYADDGTACGACAPLLHPAGCMCADCLYADAHSDDAPDWGAR